MGGMQAVRRVSRRQERKMQCRTTYQSASPDLFQLERKPRAFSTASIVCVDIDAGETERKLNPTRAVDEKEDAKDVATV